MQRIIIDNLSDLQPFYSQPVTLKGLSGVIDSLVIMGCKTDYDQFLLTLIDCDGLRIRELVLEGQQSGIDKQGWIDRVPSGLHLLSKNVTIERVSLSELHNGVVIRGRNSAVIGGDISNISGDFVQMCANGCIVHGLTCSGSLDVFGDSLHRDVVQLFPIGGGTLSNCTISNISYSANDHKWVAKPQGILASDGKFTGIEVTDCRLVGVHELHGISFLVDATGCRLSDNVTNGLIRIDETVNEVSNNQIIGHNLDNVQTKGLMMSNKVIKQSGDLLQWAADTLQVERAVISAVVEVESSGKTGAMLFERHKFYDALQGAGANIGELLRQNPALAEIINPIPYKRGRVGKDAYGTHKKQAERLEWAKRVNPEAALKATSWGQFQIMGFNHQLAGFDDVFSFVEAMQSHEGQVRAFVQFIKASKLADELQRKDWTGFAKGYNGKNYKGDPATQEDDYDWKLSRAYQRYVAQEEPKKPLIRSKTALLTTAGATVAGGAAYTANDALDALNSVQDGLAVIADNAAAIKGVGEQVAELAGTVDALSVLPWLVGGTLLVTCLLFAFVLYVYLVDHGYIKSN